MLKLFRARSLVAEKGQLGALHYGPYIDVDPGNYTVSFDVSVESLSGATVRLDVATAPDQKILAESILIDNTVPKQLNFTLDKLATAENLGNGATAKWRFLVRDSRRACVFTERKRSENAGFTKRRQAIA